MVIRSRVLRKPLNQDVIPLCPSHSKQSRTAPISMYSVVAMFRPLLLAILAVSFYVVCAQPVQEARRIAPPGYDQTGRLRIIGVGSAVQSFNKTVAYDRSGTLALGSSPNSFSAVSTKDFPYHRTHDLLRQPADTIFLSV